MLVAVRWRRLPPFPCFAEVAIPTKFKIFAIAAALAAGTSSAAMASGGGGTYGRPSPEVTCPAGYALYNSYRCAPVAAPGDGNPCAAGYLYSLGRCYPAH